MLTILIRLIYLTGFINSYAELLYPSQHQNDHDVFVDLEAAYKNMTANPRRLILEIEINNVCFNI